MSIGKHEARRCEYTRVDIDFDDLSAFGAQGWEFVTQLTADETSSRSLLLKRTGLSFQERMTMDQRRRYFATTGIDIDARDLDLQS